MSHRGHGGKSPTPGLSPPFPPRLENPANDAGFSTFPQGTAAGLTIPLQNQTGNPKNLNLVNSRGLPLSCGERKKESRTAPRGIKQQERAQSDRQPSAPW